MLKKFNAASRKDQVLILLFLIIWLFIIEITAYLLIDPARQRADLPLSATTVWARWDGIYYHRLATLGYDQVTAVFFPLYPLLIRLADKAGFNPYGAGHFSSLIFLFFSQYFLYRLLRLDYPPKTAYLALLFLLLFPSAFFLIALYPESLLLFFCLASFYAARKNKWWLAGLLAGLASATKLIGVIMLPVLAAEYWLQKKSADQKLKKNGVLWLLLCPSGLIAYSLYCYYKFGYFFAFLQNQPLYGSQLRWPWQTLSLYFNRMTENMNIKNYAFVGVEWLNLFLILLALSLFLMAVKKLRSSYLLLLGLIIVYPFFATLPSFNRFILTAFPLFLCLALIKNRLWRYSLMFILFLIQIWFVSLFINGYWVA